MYMEKRGKEVKEQQVEERKPTEGRSNTNSSMHKSNKNRGWDIVFEGQPKK